MRSRRAPRGRCLHPYRQRGADWLGSAALSCPDAAAARRSSCACALLAACERTAGVRGHARRPAGCADRRALRSAARPASAGALRTDERRRAAGARRDARAPRRQPRARGSAGACGCCRRGSSCVGGLPCAWALRLGCGLIASRPCPAPADAPRLMYARVVRRHPPEGSPPGWLARPRRAHALPRARGRRAVLALLARRRLALDAARRDAARRAQGARCRGSTSTTRATGRRSRSGSRPTARCSSTGARTAPASGGRSRARRSSPIPAASARTRSRGSRSARTPTWPAAVTARPRWWRCDPRVATFVHQRVETAIGPVATRRDRRPPRRRARHPRPRRAAARRRRSRSRSSTASPGR